ncbi:MAG TPA: ABC transporter permease, partial [Gemmatimonadales bacterium]|nr:ABC transporter permease [Gemmatimonadales bacterium]
PVSRGVADRLTASGRFRLAGASPSVELANEAMLDRRTDLIVVVPQGLERELVRTGHGTVQLIFNAEDGAAAGVMQAYVAEILERYSAELGAGSEPLRGTIEVRQRGWYNAQFRYIDYMVPGILVVLVTMIGTLLTAMNIVREKEAGTLDQLNVTPITRSTFIAAKLIPLWSLALLDLALGLILAHFAFAVPIRGSLLLVFAAAAIYLLGALGIGLWISTIAETQQQAIFITFALMLIYVLMSGLFTPVRGMPDWAQWLAQLNPVTHFVRLMRAVLLKGAGAADVARQLGMLVLIGAVVLPLAVRQYRKRAA